MSRFFDWTPDDNPAEILRPQSADDWRGLHERYAQAGDGAPLTRVLELRCPKCPPFMEAPTFRCIACGTGWWDDPEEVRDG